MTHRYRLRSAWNRVGSGEIHRAPLKWQAWLSDTGSLTQKIEQVIGQKLEDKGQPKIIRSIQKMNTLIE